MKRTRNSVVLTVALLAMTSLAKAAEWGDFMGGGQAPGDSVEYQMHEAPAPRSQDPTILENSVRGSFLAHKTSSDTWSIQQSAGSFHLSSTPRISPTGPVVPRDLWDVETGARYRHRMGERREWGLAASVGSASDEPFHSIKETTFRVTGTYRMPARQNNSWLFFLAYSNNRYFANGVPLPGAAYVIHAPDHGLDAVVGLPFLACNYKPAPDWSGRLTIFGPDSISAEWGYLGWKPVHAYAGYDWSQKQWLRADRTDNKQRLFFDEKKWILGVRFPVLRELRADIAALYEFDRRFYDSVRAVRGGIPEADLSAAWAFQARLSARW